ncbi:MAG: hypothetical protein Q9P44_11565 [Anaerolineae bacterium]|nr:hypothetical protein [Anaerolineae bacterium]
MGGIAGGVVIEEYSEQGPVIMGAHDATTLTGERLSSISALPGRDAQIPYAPRARYIPSDSELEINSIDSVGEKAQ